MTRDADVARAAGPAPTGEHDAVALAGVSKVYGDDAYPVQALRDVSLRVAHGEFVVLLGPSGSGKTTLLNIVGGIEPPTEGTVTVDGERVDRLSAEARTDYRRRSVGFVFQFINLVPTLTAAENVQFVAELRSDLGTALPRTTQALSDVGLADRADHYPAQLSGGEQQRVAIARALVNRPAILLCDEPTGSLDLETGRTVLGLLREAGGSTRTVLLVTHNSAIAGMADRVLRMRSGQIVGDERIERPLHADEVTW